MCWEAFGNQEQEEEEDIAGQAGVQVAAVQEEPVTRSHRSSWRRRLTWSARFGGVAPALECQTLM